MPTSWICCVLHCTLMKCLDITISLQSLKGWKVTCLRYEHLQCAHTKIPWQAIRSTFNWSAKLFFSFQDMTLVESTFNQSELQVTPPCSSLIGPAQKVFRVKTSVPAFALGDLIKKFKNVYLDVIFWKETVSSEYEFLQWDSCFVFTWVERKVFLHIIRHAN